MSEHTDISNSSKKDTVKRVLQITETVFSWLIVALAVCMMVFTLISVGVINRTDRTILGYKMFICKSDSMAATDFKVGDIVLTKAVDPTTLKEGDIITFLSQDSDRFGMVVTHKIREKAVDGMGMPGFVTYGTTTGANDESIATYEYIIGKYQGRIPALGNFMMFLKTGPGFMLLILIPFLFVLLSHGMNVVREFLRWKREQMQEIDEKQQIIQSMAEELKELQKRYENEYVHGPPEEQELVADEATEADTLSETDEFPEENAPLTEAEDEEGLLYEVQRIVQEALDKLLPPPPVLEQPAQEAPAVMETSESTTDEEAVSDHGDEAIGEAPKRKKKRSNKSKKKNRRKRTKKKGKTKIKSSARKKKQNRKK